MKKLIIILVILLSIVETFGQTNPKCAGKTQAGIQCSRTAKPDDTKCFQHSDKAIRCGSKTKAGSDCKVVVKEAGVKCHNHKEVK